MSSCSMLQNIITDCQSQDDWKKMCKDFLIESNFKSYMKVVHTYFKSMGVIGISPAEVTIDTQLDFSKECVLQKNNIEVVFTITYNRHQHLSREGTIAIYYLKRKKPQWFPFSMDLRELLKDNGILTWFMRKYAGAELLEDNQYYYTYTHSKFRFIFKNEQLLFVDEKRWSDGAEMEKLSMRFWHKRFDRMKLKINEKFKSKNHVIF